MTTYNVPTDLARRVDELERRIAILERVRRISPGSIPHGILTEITPNDHHQETHDFDSEVHTGGLEHNALVITPDDHHDKVHSIGSAAFHTGTITATQHGDMTSGSHVHTHSNDHVRAHQIDSITDHSSVGGTTGEVLKVSSAGLPELGQLQHNQLGGVTTGQHHAQAHGMTSTNHTDTGLTVGHVLKATGAATFDWGSLTHASLATVTANQHHTEKHGPGEHTGGAVWVYDESTLEGAAWDLQFTGAGVSVTFASGRATINIP